MNRIKLTTNDIFTQKGRRMKILTDGIDMVRFTGNPLMLFQHNAEKIIGLWDSVEKNEEDITAIPSFDNDELSVDIKNKFSKGTVKSASVGLEVDESYLEGEVLIISKSTLLEASLVGIPANPNAKKVELSNTIMLFSNGKELDEDYINKIKDMKKEELKTEDTNEIVTEDKVIDATEDIKTEDLKAEKLELSLKLTDLEKNIVELNSNTDKLELSLKSKDSEIVELKSQLESLKADKMNILLSNAISDGKISKEAKEDFLELSYERAESILKKITPSQVSLSETLELSKETNNEKSYNWYLKNDKTGLKKLSKENPALYKQLESNYINNIKK